MAKITFVTCSELPLGSGDDLPAILALQKLGVDVRFGGYSTAAIPPADTVKHCDEIVLAIPYPWTFARVDGLLEGDSFLLMELELIEPMLFFSFVPGASERFATEIVNVLA